MKKKILFIIDPQNDFITGSLKVPGASEAMGNLVEHLKSNPGYDEIYVTLDTHNPTNLGFKESWEGPDLSKVEPGSPFPTDLIKAGGIQPKPWYTRDRDTQLILRQPGFMCWPPHCIKGTTGYQVWGPLEEELRRIPGGAVFLSKGEDDARDCYSVFQYGDNELTRIGGLWRDLDIKDTDFYFAGLALDYCVLETVRSLQTICGDCTYTVLESMGSGIRSKEDCRELYKSLNERVNIVI